MAPKYRSSLMLFALTFLFLSISVPTKGWCGQVEATWNELQVTGTKPYARDFSRGIIDPIGGRMIIFGGWSGIPYDSLNDTWALDLNTHTWTEISTTGGPPPKRAGYVGVYDSLRRRLIVVAGSNWWQTWYNDVWALDLSTYQWSELQTSGAKPSKRFCHCGVYDPVTDNVFIFGGRCGSCWNWWLTNEVWAFNLTSLQWNLLSTSGGPPSARATATAVLDDKNHEMLIFGGDGCSDVWALDLNTYTWFPRGDLGSNRYHHRSVFDPVARQMITVAGWGGPHFCEVLDVDSDVFLDVITQGSVPPDRGNPVAIYDLDRQRLIMFGGGLSLSTQFDDLWELYLDSPFELSVDPDPLYAGRYATFGVINGRASTPTFLAYSLAGPGSTYIPPLAVTLDLANPRQAGSPKMSDSRGTAIWAFIIPQAGAGYKIWCQAAQYGQVSNAIATSIQ